jgi:small subunit ribosomal protein S1
MSTESPESSKADTESPQVAEGDSKPEAAGPGGQADAAGAGQPAVPEAAGDGSSGSRPRIEVGSRPGGAVRTGADRPAREDFRRRQERMPRDSRAARDRAKSGGDEGAGPDDAASEAEIPRASIPVPSKREGLSPELEAELNAAFGEISLDQVIGQDAAGRAAQQFEPDSRTRGTVMRVAGDNVFVSLGGRNEGLVSARQFKQPPAVGSEIEVVVKSFHVDDGLYELVVPGAAIDVADWDDLTQGAVVDARITGANTGGLECMVNTIRGFIPASQIGLFRVESFGDYIHQKLPCVVTEVNARRKKLVLSHRAVLEREKEEARKQFLEQLAPGQVYEGVVRKIQDFGVFVDIGGADGLVHVSQLSWDRVNHPSDVVQEGQRIRVKVEKFNAQTGKISLSHRDLLERPWDDIEQKFPVGSTVKGVISRIAKFGAFVKLAPGIEGLIHISELAHGHVRRVEDVLKEGQDVEVKILSVDPDAQRMALSYKATLPPPESAKEEALDAQEGLRAPLVPRRNRPLRGGFDRPAGGDKFGLNW